ncbi:hypothetical protein [Streptomyces sp. NPDC048111]|uniref:hypothetical protein n=1 Tax=Streptomyces sp. NPDC048111 TaxID=3365500 RepID=UPI00371642F3
MKILDLDENGRLLDGGHPVPAHRLDDHFAEALRPRHGATDIVLYTHGWQTGPQAAERAAGRLLALAADQYRDHRALYPALARWTPWPVLVRWPSRSGPLLGGYRRIRDRAHALSAPGGHAGRVIGTLLGCLDTLRGDPREGVLAGRGGQYLHLVGHSFGCRVLCEAVQWAAREPDVLGWSRPGPAGLPFTVDSMLLLQMAAPRDAFAQTFTALDAAPLRGPVVATYAQRDRATGFWHRIAEQRAGMGNQGIGTAPRPVSAIAMLAPDTAYPRSALDHWFVSVDAGAVFTGGHGPAGAHSDHVRAESAHLLLSLAGHSR